MAKNFQDTHQNVGEGETNCEVCKPVHDGCYADSNRPRLLEEELGNHQPRDAPCTRWRNSVCIVVEPPNNAASHFILYREVVLSSEVKMY